MKSQMLMKAHRPVLSGHLANTASGPTARACFARNRTPTRFAVRGCALPGRDARHCSPPTATSKQDGNHTALSARASSHHLLVFSGGIQTLESKAVSGHVSDLMGAIACPEIHAEVGGLIAPRVYHCANRATALNVPPRESIKLRSLNPVETPHCLARVPLAVHRFTSAMMFRRLAPSSSEIRAAAFSFHPRFNTQIPKVSLLVPAKAVLRFRLSSRLVALSCRVIEHLNAVGTFTVFSFASRVAFWASSEARPNFYHRVVLSGVAGLLVGALAAAPGCIKMLCILFSSFAAFACYRASQRFVRRVFLCADGESGRFQNK